MNTRENIIETSLNLFAIKGYDAVSIRDIAKNIGIKGSSIYNHFKSKSHIFNTTVSIYTEYIEKSFKTLTKNSLLKNNKNYLSDEIFLQENMKIFYFLMNNHYCIKLRNILTIEQYNNPKAFHLFNKLFIDDIIEYEKEIFTALINNHIFIEEDPYFLAVKLYSPMFLLLYKGNNLDEKNIILLKNHILNFKHDYSFKG